MSTLDQEVDQTDRMLAAQAAVREARNREQSQSWYIRTFGPVVGSLLWAEDQRKRG